MRWCPIEVFSEKYRQCSSIMAARNLLLDQKSCSSSRRWITSTTSTIERGCRDTFFKVRRVWAKRRAIPVVWHYTDRFKFLRDLKTRFQISHTSHISRWHEYVYYPSVCKFPTRAGQWLSLSCACLGQVGIEFGYGSGHGNSISWSN